MTDNTNEVFVPAIGLTPVVKISGETLYGSERLNRKFVGFEKEKKWVKVIKDRLKNSHNLKNG